MRRHAVGSTGVLLGRLRVRGQLVLVLTLPLLAVLALSGVAVYAAVSRIQSADSGLRLVHLSAAAGDLAAALQAERTSAMRVLQEPQGDWQAEFARRTEASDAAIDRLKQNLVSVPAGETAQAAVRVEAALRQLVLLRVRVQSDGRMSLQGVVLRYRLLIADLIQLRQAPLLAGLPGDLADRARAAWALSVAAEQAALAQVTVIGSAGQEWSPAQLSRFVAAQSGYTEALREASSAVPVWRAWWEQTVSGDAVLNVQRLEGSVARTRLGDPLRVDAAGWAGSGSSRLGLMNQVITRVDEQLAGVVQTARDYQVRQLLLLAAATVAVVAAALVVGAVVIRALSRRLRQLEADATQVAHHHLPRALTRVGQAEIGADPGDVVRDASLSLPVPAGGRDEVAGVGRALDLVAKEAIRLAVGEALAKSVVRQTHMDIARRMQRLLGALQGRLDELERKEQDPVRLKAIFGVDAAVARVMRFTAGLLVLAGGSSELPRNEPVDLHDVAMAAMGQVEQYPRVELQIEPGVWILPPVVDDLVHLLAEIIDNATTYSSPETMVVVRGWRAGPAAVVTVEDLGIGIRRERLEQLNQELANPGEVVSPRSLGLATVARLAARHGLSVQLARGATTMAEVRLPAQTLQMQARHAHLDPSSTMLIPRPFERPRAGLAPQARALTGRDSAMAGPALDSTLAAAQAAGRAPAVAATTAQGLPVRRPHTNLFPGQIPAPTRHPYTLVDPRTAQAAMRNYQRGLLAAGRLPQPRSPLSTEN